ncbi:glycosyltransferase family 9 protein [Shewanella kaireitica]|uniref:glycosyltransferase family 9 protein n=1 Tax=Shewanella kaireitica TaxID=212021 RepID=UPI00200D5B1D|nr:glycosyltransferase family 9 protein [Shewanella kaireitica]MCL1095333.1 glycosyltransferase family 9 protein [Shewanella kaireitica]
MKRILVFRHDKIGDFVLLWPALSLLKNAMPDTSIEVFVTPILKSFALACPYVDHVIVDSGDDLAIRKEIDARQYDAALVSNSQFRIYKIIRNLNIPYVLAPKHNWYQYFYKNRTDAQYKVGEGCWRGGCMLIEAFLTAHNMAIPALPKRYWDVTAEREHWQQYYGKQNDEKLIFVHPGTGGSSGSLPTKDFIKLITQVDQSTQHKCRFVLTFSGEEASLAKAIFDEVSKQGVNITLANPLKDLTDFAKSIVAADMFMAGSTGPLHIAGLHNVPTVGFYAGRKSQPKVRWQTLSEQHKRLAFTPPESKRTGRDMSLVDIDYTAKTIAEFLNTYYTK